MSGGGTIQPGNPRRGGVVNNMFAVVVDPARLAGADWLRREIDGFVSYVKASPPWTPPPRAGARRPGAGLARRARRTGIPLDPTTWEGVLASGETLGLSRKDAETIAAPSA